MAKHGPLRHLWAARGAARQKTLGRDQLELDGLSVDPEAFPDEWYRVRRPPPSTESSLCQEGG